MTVKPPSPDPIRGQRGTGPGLAPDGGRGASSAWRIPNASCIRPD
jgi:hypothetical protein